MNINKSDSLKFCLNFLNTHMKQDFILKNDTDKHDLQKNELKKYGHSSFRKIVVEFTLPIIHYPYFTTDKTKFEVQDTILFFKDRNVDLEMNFFINKFNNHKFYTHYKNLSQSESIFLFRYFESKKIYFIYSGESSNENFYLLINMNIFFDNILKNDEVYL